MISNTKMAAGGPKLVEPNQLKTRVMKRLQCVCVHDGMLDRHVCFWQWSHCDHTIGCRAITTTAPHHERGAV